MQDSTLVSICPQCQERVLVDRVQASIRCVACNFDYTLLARDDAARERWMLANLADGPVGILMTLALHRLILALPLQESNARVVAFAEENGIAMPKEGSPRLLLLAAAAIAGLLFVAAVVAFVVLR